MSNELVKYETLDIRLSKVEQRDKSNCGVCGEEVKVPSLYDKITHFIFKSMFKPLPEVYECPACKTKYHKDCFEYNGRCSTYGCNVVLEDMLEYSSVNRNLKDINRRSYTHTIAMFIGICGIGSWINGGASNLWLYACSQAALIGMFCGYISCGDKREFLNRQKNKLVERITNRKQLTQNAPCKK
ncbi:hypothetical protein KY330_04240 [Candidatus Woesearchaeota archaeon]|nr:hypothetical protein [Candidatus Woesearchaeota archaeon]